jgi:hypothetical protein
MLLGLRQANIDPAKAGYFHRWIGRLRNHRRTALHKWLEEWSGSSCHPHDADVVCASSRRSAPGSGGSSSHACWHRAHVGTSERREPARGTLHRLDQIVGSLGGTVETGAAPTPGSGPCSGQGSVRGSGDRPLRIRVRRTPVATITAGSSRWRPHDHPKGAW